MVKTYSLHHCNLEVSFTEKAIHISQPKELKKFLSKDIEARSEHLVKLIKSDYLIIYGSELLITDDSIIVEIWGHLWASLFAKAIKNLIALHLVENIADFIIKKSDTIDCGEREVDHNRLFWDVLANFKGVILTFLPRKIIS